jgi:hypothetical protein
VAGELVGAIRSPVQPCGIGEVRGQVTGPPPRLDGHRSIEQVQIRRDAASVYRLAQGQARPVPQQAGDARVARDAERCRS